LLSENTVRNSAGSRSSGEPPVRLLEERMREVSPLEFHPLKRPEVVTVFEPIREVLMEEQAADLDQRLRSQEEQVLERIEEARAEAKDEARREYEEELEKKILEERSLLLKTHQDFVEERTRYFAGVEAEVVKLALAIAARVLHREATLDPLLLAGVVRVALSKVTEDSTAALRVAGSELESWQEIFKDDLALSLQLKSDETLRAGECVLETSVGKVELGVNAQLAEIERGFFDLLQQRPA